MSISEPRKFLSAIAVIVLTLVIPSCGGGSGGSPSAPRIVDLKVDPELVCVGSKATISFTLMDANNDEIVWVATVSSSVHGGLEPATGSVSAGTRVFTEFDAATSGRHNHTEGIHIEAADTTGLKADPVDSSLFVFNCT